MVRIMRDVNKKGTGAPRGSATGVSMSAMTGGLVNRTKAARGSVRRLIARDPAKGVSANIGTKRDILGFTNDADIPNTTDAPNPTILSAKNPRNSVPTGRKGFSDRSSNRSLKKR